MRVSTMIRFTPSDDPHDRLLDRTADYARRIEASGFPGIWVGDSLGRGRPTLDPLVELAVLAAVTRNVELGISVLQLPLRHPIELAHRVQSVQVLSGNRFTLGVGSGSTKDDFDLLGYDGAGHVGDAGDVAARSVEAGHQAILDRVVANFKNDRNGRGRSFGSERPGCAPRRG